MLKNFKQLTFAISILACSVLSAQTDFTMYNMSFVPQSQFLNPATAPKTKFYLGGSGNLGVGLPFSFNDIVKEQVNDTTLKINVKEALGSMNNRLNIPARSGLDLSIGGRINSKLFIHAGITEKIYSNFSMSKDLIGLLLLGNANADNIGKDLNVGGFQYNAAHYREYFVGGSYSPNCNLSFGGRLKYLQGFENVQIKKSVLSLTTDPTTFDLTAKGDIDIRTAGIDTTQDYLENKYADITNVKPVGSGFGVDLGFKILILDEKLTLGGSLLDFGAITWKKELKQIKSTNPGGNFTFRGIDVYEFINNKDTTSSISQEISDTLTKTFDLELKDATSTYTTFLPTKLYFSGDYRLFKNTQVGANILMEFYNKKPHLGGALYARQDIWRILQFQANFNYYNKHASIGTGLALNLGIIQFFVLSDNLVGTLVKPKNAVALNLRTGLNIVWPFGKFKKPCEIEDFGKQKKYRIKDKDGDGVEDLIDLCPNTKGSTLAKGCPDADGDGVKDADDKCPLTAGLIALNGCPDKDADGIIDIEDACPDVYGVKETKGCPDTDGDGIKDEDDKCPYDKGSVTLNGCPDKDGDGVIDKDDACPDVKGKKDKDGCPDDMFDTDHDGVMDNEDACVDVAGRVDNKGCPGIPEKDTDGDGVLDSKDKCPKTFGSVSNDGCPEIKSGNLDRDTDGDGVLDSKDKCPKTFGLASNDGCPEIKKEDKEVLDLAFKNLEFNTGSAIISPKSFISLDNLAKILKSNPTYKLSIEGHTDNKGNAASNLQLSKNRAMAVKTYLVQKSIAISRMTSQGFGSKIPVATNDTEEGRQQNRRVVMKVIFE